MFVATNSGWFSDRSAAYLASGRPVVIQDTGFGDYLPVGRGLFAVKNIDQAVAAIESIAANYPAHSRWARELALEYLESVKVLARFLDELGASIGAVSGAGGRALTWREEPPCRSVIACGSWCSGTS